MKDRANRGVYYCNGAMPTEADFALAKSLGITAFRNAKKAGVFPVGAVLLAGHVPAAYKGKAGVKYVDPPKEPPKEQAQQAQQQQNKGK